MVKTPFCIAVYQLNNLPESVADYGEIETMEEIACIIMLLFFLSYIIQQNAKKRMSKIDKKSLPC